MSRLLRRLVVGLGTYVAGVAIGAVIALGSASPAAVVSQASPTHSPVASGTPSLSRSPEPTARATATAGATPTALASAAHTVTPSVAPTVTLAPTQTPTADPDAIAAFIADLGDAIARGRAEFLFTNLDPAVLDRYGEDACREYTASTQIEGLRIEYVSAAGPAPWEWTLDDRTTAIPDAWSVTVDWHQPGLDEQREIHIAPADATWRWFTDCGDPLS